MSVIPLPSLIPRQLPASPMAILARGVEHVIDVTVDRPHHPNQPSAVVQGSHADGKDRPPHRHFHP
jgi:hypothetical protein